MAQTPHPERFILQRFLDSEGELRLRKHKSMPFGAGIRWALSE